jgi:hypothetical protein
MRWPTSTASRTPSGCGFRCRSCSPRTDGTRTPDRYGRAEAADLVAARDKIALILDGFDEMDPALRPAALQALSDAPFRVVMLTRSQELLQAASHTWLTGALAVRLRLMSRLTRSPKL